MTQDELMILRDVTAYFGQREEIRDGQRVVIPVQPASQVGLLWREDHEPIYVYDADGLRWEVGRWKGEMVRRRWGW